MANCVRGITLVLVLVVAAPAWAQGPIRRTQPDASAREGTRDSALAPRVTPRRVIRIRPPRPGELPPTTSATVAPETKPTPPPLRIVEPGDPAKTIVATVEGEQLTLKEVEEQLGFIRSPAFSGPTEEVERYRRAYKRQIMNDWVDTKLLTVEARTRGLNVTRDEVDRYIQGTALDSGLQIPAAERARLVGVSEEKFRAAVEDGILGEKLIRQVIREKVTDAMLTEAINKSPLVAMAPPRRHVRQIVSLFEGTETPDQVKEMRSKMKAIRRRLTWFGGKFEEYGYERGIPGRLFVYDLGWLAVGDRFEPKSQFIYALVFRLEAARPGKESQYVLKKGEISEVIDSPTGFHIFQAIDEQPARRKTLEEVRVTVETTFYDQVRTGLLKELAKKRRVERDPDGLFGRSTASSLNIAPRTLPSPAERNPAGAAAKSNPDLRTPVSATASSNRTAATSLVGDGQSNLSPSVKKSR